MRRSSKSGETSLARYDIIVKTFWGLPSCFLVWIENFSSQHQTSTTLSGTCGRNRSTPALPRSPLCVPTSTPKPRAEGRWPPVALCRAGLGSRLGRCWALPTGEQHPSRQPRPSPFATSKIVRYRFCGAWLFRLCAVGFGNEVRPQASEWFSTYKKPPMMAASLRANVARGHTNSSLSSSSKFRRSASSSVSVSSTSYTVYSSSGFT